MALQIDTFVLGPIETNCYLLRSSGQCWAVDPGIRPEPLAAFLERESLELTAVLLTHGHCDHIAGAADLQKLFPDARIVCPAGDAAMLTDPQANLSAPFGLPMVAPHADELLSPGQTIPIGHTLWKVLDTSGHTPGGASYYCAAENVLLAGDALFAGSIGRTDIPSGSASRLLKNIRENLLRLPDETHVLPGHGPETTIGRERRSNPFLIDI